MATRRFNFHLATIQSGGKEQLFAVGGRGISDVLNTVEEWVEESATWKAANNLVEKRRLFGAATVDRKHVCPEWGGSGDSEFECSSPWVSLSTGCYRFLEESMTWSEAKTACNNLSGHLVEMETEEEHVLLVAEKKKRSHLVFIWIGLNDLDEEGVWRWNEKSARTTVSRWGQGQPNSIDGAQDCAVMDFHDLNGGRWNDFWCNVRSWESHSVGAICER